MTSNRISSSGYAQAALFIALLTFAAVSRAATFTNLTLAWDANSETNLAGYRIFYGTAPGTYSTNKLVGANVTSTTISNLQSGQLYYFAAKASNVAGLESAFSAEISYTAPVPPNTAPVAIAQSVTTAEDSPKAITLAGMDADGDPLSYVIVSSPTSGTLSGTLPNLTYAPAANFSGTASFTFKVNDGATDSASATVTITVTPVNDLPVALAQSVAAAEDTAKAITLAGADVDGNSLSFVVVNGPLHGTLSGTAPNLTYTPDANYSGSDSFTFRVNDGTVDSATATVSINVTAANDVPVADAQNVVTPEDTARAITLSANDVDGNALTYSVVSGPANGTLSGTAPNLTYKPATNFFGSDSFTFRANDGTANSATATVSISVTPVNDAPLASAQSVTAAEDTAKAIVLSGTDADGDTLSFSIVTAPVHGTLSGTPPNLTYLPATNYSGADSFTFKANDGTADSATATVSITVTSGNDAPSAVAQSVTTAEDTAKAITLTGTDPDGNTLTYSITTGPAHGSLSGSAPNFTYTPAANYNGSDSFSFKVNDGVVDSTPATITLTITSVNDAPVALAQSVSATEDAAKAITLGATDADGDSLTFSVVSGPTKGSLSGTAPNLLYTPSANYNGSDSFTFKANDGTADSAAVTVAISVTAANDAPVALAQSVTTAEDTAKPITLAGTDLDGNALTYTITASPAHGTLSGSAPNLTYTPTSNYNGSDSFAFKVNDGTTDSAVATVSINVTSVNDTPVAAAQAIATDRNVAKNITLAGSDADDDTLTYAIVTQPTKGVLSGTAPNLIYTPNNNVTGADSFTFQVNDGTVNSAAATVSISIAPGPNAPPVADAQTVAATEDVAKPITLTGSDSDGNALTFAITTSPLHGTLTGTPPNVTYTPAANYNGSDSFWFRVNDGTTNSAQVVVSITVAPANDAPAATAQSLSTAEDTAKAIALAGTDIDNDALTFAIVAAPVHGTLSGTPPNVIYQPATNYTGPDSFSFKANDGTTDSPSAVVSITVTPANDAPVALAQAVTVTEDVAKTITLTGSDADGNPLSYSVVNAPLHGTLTGTAPNLTYKPATNYNGSDSFSFKVNDGTLDSASAVVSITITPANDAPLAIEQSVATDKNVAKAITLTGSDIDGDALTFTMVTQPTKGTLSGTPPNLTYTPNSNVTGADVFTFKANDGTVESAAAAVYININAGPNTPPVADSQTVATLEDTPKAITLTANDEDGNAVSYSIVTQPTHGTLSGTPPGVTYTPTQDYSGSDVFWFKASDGATDSVPVAVSITISPVNDQPTLNTINNLTLSSGAGAQSVPLSSISAGSNETQPLTITAASSNPSLIPNPTVNYSGPASTGSLGFTPSSTGSGTATITVTVNDGQPTNNTVVRTFTVTVNAVVAPSIVLTGPMDGSSYSPPAAIRLAADVTANGHTINKVQFRSGTNVLGEAFASPYELNWTTTNTGTFPLVARLVYNGSSTLDSAPVNIEVSDLPGPWAPAVIGSNAVPGSVNVSGDLFTVEGAGALAGTSDSLEFIHQALTEDGEIRLRINSLANSGKNSRAGVMIRENMAPGSKYVFLGISGDGYFRWHARTSTNGKTIMGATRSGSPGKMVRLVRVGKTITCYWSLDGLKWTRISSVSVYMAPTTRIGLAVASGSSTSLSCATFSSPTVVP